MSDLGFSLSVRSNSGRLHGHTFGGAVGEVATGSASH